ncbi:MAG: MotA/TolQ/ExbB proton channel family protein [candidate division KSB1 bacterium]|nr:MotA/TolQ/ExbB proton channel family protein [candidate division KSB1 bacterium]MDQ7064577.1 MotA/TolQ/ExbB proton channel family protein [candidate division KSB1 bacterium]
MSEIIAGFSPDSGGFYFMVALAIVAAVAIAIAIERTYYIIVRSNIDAPKFMAEIRKLVRAGEYKRALALCEAAPNKALPKVVGAGLRKVAESESIDFRTIQNSVDEGTLEVIPKLQERTGFLAMLANVATLIGLMGTIWGLILAFRSVSVAGIDAAEKSRMLAAGISTAMNTTLLGLAIAIPSILVYTFLHNKTIKIIDEIDEHTVKLINLITGNQ